MTVILTLKYADSNLPSGSRDDVKTYDTVVCLDIDAETGFLTIQTESGDFTFDKRVWVSFLVSRD